VCTREADEQGGVGVDQQRGRRLDGVLKIYKAGNKPSAPHKTSCIRKGTSSIFRKQGSQGGVQEAVVV